MHNDLACTLCGRSTFSRYRRPGSPWICGVCVPPELETYEVKWGEEMLQRAQRQPSAPAGASASWRCPTCGGTGWWRHFPLEPWYCAACVPPVLEPVHVERTEGVRP